MNIRKNIDYSEMYEALDRLMTQQLPQMELYCAIGKAICRRAEKGAAVMAAEYLHEQYPDVSGSSPRNVRRMRDFCRTYENHPALLRRAMELGWSQNVAIMEADLPMNLREWYMKAAKQFGWSKAELIENIKNEVHEEIVLDIGQTLYDNKPNNNNENNFGEDRDNIVNIFCVYVFQLIRKRIMIFRCRGKPERLCKDFERKEERPWQEKMELTVLLLEIRTCQPMMMWRRFRNTMSVKRAVIAIRTLYLTALR